MNQSKKNVLITGGSSGIGFELSKLFAKDGYNLIIVSKPADELERAKKYFNENFKSTEVITFQKNLAVQGASKEVYDFTKEKNLDIEILVNCAGFGTYGKFDTIPREKDIAMINLNSITLYDMTRLFIDDMIMRDRGRILNVASSVAYAPVPYHAAYSATKVFALNFSRAVSYELKDNGSNVSITVLCPPQTNTGFAKAANMENSPLFKPGNKFLAEPEDVAAAGYKGLMAGKLEVAPIPGGKFSLDIMNRLLPLNTVMGIFGKQVK